MLFSIQILIRNVLKIFIFSDFGKILVLANAFFYSNSNFSVLKNCFFPAFGKIFGFW